MNSTGQIALERLIFRILGYLCRDQSVLTRDSRDLVNEGCLILDRSSFAEDTVETLDEFLKIQGGLSRCVATTSAHRAQHRVALVVVFTSPRFSLRISNDIVSREGDTSQVDLLRRNPMQPLAQKFGEGRKIFELRVALMM